MWTEVHGIGPDRPSEVMRSQSGRFLNFGIGVAFVNHDWPERWNKLRNAMTYISRYTSNTVNDMMDWPMSLLVEVQDDVIDIIERENRSGRSND